MALVDYNMQNPMNAFFQTAGGLQQLQQNQMAMQQQQQQQQAAQAQQAKIQELMPRVQAGDYNAAIELATVSPQLSDAITKAKANMREGQDRATADWIAGYQAAPDKEAYLASDNQSIDIDDQFRQMPPEQRDVLTKIVGAQVMPEQMFNATFGQPKEQRQQASPANVQEFEYFSNLTPEQQQKYLEVKRGQQLTPEQKAQGKGLETQTVEERKAGVKALTDITASEKSAASQMATLSNLEKLSDKAFEGGFSETKKFAGRLASNLGLNIEGMSESEVFEALANSVVLDASQMMSGALSNADMAFLQNTVPTLTQSKEGRKELISIMRKASQRKIDYAKAARKFRKENGYFDENEFRDEFDAENKPLFDGEKQKSTSKDEFLGRQPKASQPVTIGRFTIVEE